MIKKQSKLRDPEVCKYIRKLWNKGLSRKRIAQIVCVSGTHISKITRNWKPPAYKEPTHVRSFDYHLAYVLKFEHGLDYADIARVLGVEYQALHKALKKNQAHLEETLEVWKIQHTRWRLSLRPKHLYSNSVRRHLQWEARSQEEKTRQLEKRRNNGFTKQGEKLSQVMCPYCGKQGAGGVMKYHHFDNCKQKPLALAAE